MSVSAHKYICLCMYLPIHACIYVCMGIRVLMAWAYRQYAYAYIQTHTHTHTHKHTHKIHGRAKSRPDPRTHIEFIRVDKFHKIISKFGICFRESLRENRDDVCADLRRRCKQYHPSYVAGEDARKREQPSECNRLASQRRFTLPYNCLKCPQMHENKQM